MLQKDFELMYSKSVLFIVLLRFLTLGKDANYFRDYKITHGYLEVIQTFVHLLKIPVSSQCYFSSG